jgi:hypothetical protein
VLKVININVNDYINVYVNNYVDKTVYLLCLEK